MLAKFLRISTLSSSLVASFWIAKPLRIRATTHLRFKKRVALVSGDHMAMLF